MSGTINLALSQQFDADGHPLLGGRLFFFAASTSTPQDSFQDFGLTAAHPNPLILDSGGRVPMFYLADGQIKVRLEDDAGLTIFAADNLLVIGPSTGGGGGGGSVDVTTVLAVGDIKARFGTGTLTGFVRCNGNTIGNTSSSSSELADPTAEALFKYLWTTPLAIFTSAGGASTKTSANNDWLANKRMALPDLRGRSIAGLDDMGAAAAGRLTSTYWGASGIVLGNAGGSEQKALLEANMASHTHAGTTGGESIGHTHSGATGTESANHTHAFDATNAAVAAGFAFNALVTGGTVITSTESVNHTHSFTTGGNSIGHNHSFTTNGGSGSATPVATATPSMAMTLYMKL